MVFKLLEVLPPASSDVFLVMTEEPMLISCTLERRLPHLLRLTFSDSPVKRGDTLTTQEAWLSERTVFSSQFICDYSHFTSLQFQASSADANLMDIGLTIRLKVFLSIFTSPVDGSTLHGYLICKIAHRTPQIRLMFRDSHNFPEHPIIRLHTITQCNSVRFPLKRWGISYVSTSSIVSNE